MDFLLPSYDPADQNKIFLILSAGTNCYIGVYTAAVPSAGGQALLKYSEGAPFSSTLFSCTVLRSLHPYYSQDLEFCQAVTCHIHEIQPCHALSRYCKKIHIHAAT